MTKDNRTDILSRLDAMLVQEASSTTRCFNYFKKHQDLGPSDINESCRKAMVKWLQQVQTTLSLSPDTGYIAMTIFDRYLSSGKGGSTRVLEDSVEFQLAAITSFYTAIKIHEPIVLGIDMLRVLCRNAYTETDFVSMEIDILSAVDWRVSRHTAMDFARDLFELIREDGFLPSVVLDRLIQDCERNMSNAIADIRSSCCKPSELGSYCVAIALAESTELSDTKKIAMCIRQLESCDVDLSLMGGTMLPHKPSASYSNPTATISKRIIPMSLSSIYISGTAQQA